MPRVSLARWKKMSPAQQAKVRASLGSKKRRTGIGRIRGKGSYTFGPIQSGPKKYSYDKPGPFGKVGRFLGGAAGGYLGGPSGAALGNQVGGLAHYIGRIFGSGDYVSKPGVKSNSILSPQIPSFSSGSATIRVRHREFLGDVFSSATANTFDIQSYSINPGLLKVFPWLSQVCASTFQQYRLNGMVFEFRSMSSDSLNSTNTALGQVIMATDYDSVDVAFTSKQQMENTEFGVSCKPSSNMIHAIECAPQLTSVSEKYIRAYDPPVNTDIRLYDMGKFYIATNGCQGTNVNLGELWVSYDVSLIKSIEQPPLFIQPVAQYNLNLVDATHSTGLTQTKVLDQIGLKFVYTAGTSYIQLPLSTQSGSLFSIYYNVYGASTASVASVTPTYTGGLLNYCSLLLSPYSAATSNYRGMYHVIQYNGTGTPLLPPTIAINGGVVPTAITQASLSITQVSSLYPDDNYT